MLAKTWKKILLFVLIIACLFNVINKLEIMIQEIRLRKEKNTILNSYKKALLKDANYGKRSEPWIQAVSLF